MKIMKIMKNMLYCGLLLFVVGCHDSNNDSPLKVAELDFNEVKIRNCIEDEYVADIETLSCVDVSGVDDWSDLSLLPNLSKIYLLGNGTKDNPINIDLSYAPNLESLYISAVPVGEINLTENYLLKLIQFASVTSLKSFNLQKNTQLEDITIKGVSALDELITGSMENLTKVEVTNALIEEFAIDAPNLMYLDLNYNYSLSALYLQSTPNIKSLILNFNNLSYVDFSPLINNNATIIITNNPLSDDMLTYIESLVANDIFNIQY